MSVTLRYRPTWRTVITWALVAPARVPAAGNMAGNPTQVILGTEGRAEIPMPGLHAWFKTPPAVPALRLAAAH